RRRHTRSKRDWSSDVCSSDLVVQVEPPGRGEAIDQLLGGEPAGRQRRTPLMAVVDVAQWVLQRWGEVVVAAEHEDARDREQVAKIGRASCRERAERAEVEGAI